MADVDGLKYLLKFRALHRVLDVGEPDELDHLKIKFCERARLDMKALGAGGSYYVAHACHVQVMIERFARGAEINAFANTYSPDSQHFDVYGTPCLQIRSPVTSQVGKLLKREVVEATLLPSNFGAVVASFHVRQLGSYPADLRKIIDERIDCWRSTLCAKTLTRAQIFAQLTE